jgi:hypothetical protein
MCLSIAINRPDDVLSQACHLGFEWLVVNNDFGYHCGYVKILPGHPWHGKDYDDLLGDVQVHGGLTFAAADVPCDAAGADNGWWLGFDYMHAFDARDLPMQYVEDECRSLCEQAAAVEACA